MKGTIFAISLVSLLGVVILPACESREKKVEDARKEVRDAKEDLRNAKQELNSEYPGYRKAEELQIKDNEERIAELRRMINTGGKPLDEDRQRRIDNLEERNSELRSRLYGYESLRSDWEDFKGKFNHDMDQLKSDLRDCSKDGNN